MQSKLAHSSRVTDKKVSSIKNALKTRYGASFSISQVAREIGIPKGYLSQVLRGQRPPSLRLRRALGLVRPRQAGVRVRMTIPQAEAVLAHCRLVRGVAALEDFCGRLSFALERNA